VEDTLHLIAEVQQSLEELRANTALTRQERVSMMEAERRRLQVPFRRAHTHVVIIRFHMCLCSYRVVSQSCLCVSLRALIACLFVCCGVALLQLAMEVLEMEELKMFAEVEDIHSRSSLKDVSSRREIGHSEGPGTAVPVVAANPFAAPSFLAELEEKKKTLRKSRPSLDPAPPMTTTSDWEESRFSARGDYSDHRVAPPPLFAGSLDAPLSSQLDASTSSSMSALVAQANDEKLAAWRQFINEVSCCLRNALPFFSPSLTCTLSDLSPSPLSLPRMHLVRPLSLTSLPPSGPRGAPGGVRGRRDRGGPAGPGQERRRVRRRGAGPVRGDGGDRGRSQCSLRGNVTLSSTTLSSCR